MSIYALYDHQPSLADGVWVAPGAVVSGWVELGAWANIWYGAVLRGDLEKIQIGAKTNIQDGAVLHTDHGLPCIVGSQVTVGHRAILHSARVGDGCLVGMGAILLGGSVLGEGCLVGAGTLVPEGKIFPPRTLLLGSPARAVRKVTDQEIKHIQQNAEIYLNLALAARQAKVVT